MLPIFRVPFWKNPPVVFGLGLCSSRSCSNPFAKIPPFRSESTSGSSNVASASSSPDARVEVMLPAFDLAWITGSAVKIDGLVTFCVF